MNKEAILKHTTSYEENLIKHLQDPELAQAYLQVVLESYEQDGYTEALLLAMRDLVEAQGGIGEIAKRTTISREKLYDILAGKHNPSLDNWLKIISALGFRVRLELQEKPIALAEHALAHKE